MEFEELSDFNEFLSNIFGFVIFKELNLIFKRGSFQLLTMLYICDFWVQYCHHNDLMRSLGSTSKWSYQISTPIQDPNHYYIGRHKSAELEFSGGVTAT